MTTQTTFFAGDERAVQHYADPLREFVPVQIVDCGSVSEKANAGDLVLFSSEHFDEARAAISRLKNKKVATVYAIDGILEWRNAWENSGNEPACPWTMRPVLCDKVACIGESQARVLRDWGNAGKVEIVGIPRFDRLVSENAEPNTPDTRDTPDGHADKLNVLVMTAKCPGFTHDQQASIRRSLEDLRTWFDAHPRIADRELNVTWRLAGELADQIGVANQFTETTGKELAEILFETDVVITTPSTGQLEAMLFECPTAIVDYTNSPQYVDAAWKISCGEQIGPVVEQLAKPCQAKLTHQKLILNDALVCDGRSAERMAELILAMQRYAKSELENGGDINFPPAMLEPPNAQTGIHFQHEHLFSDHASFKQRDVLTLQAELGHARREIDHLNREIKAFQTELTEAHQIFEQIDNHPIAGPVVRTRQKLIDWMKHFRQRKVELMKSAKATNP